MKKYIIILVITSLVSCKKENEFERFEYTFSGTFTEFFSIKFTKSDTVFIHQYRINNHMNDSVSILKNNQNYFAVLNKNDKQKLYRFIETIDFNKFKDEYSESYLDGRGYRMDIIRNSTMKTVLVNSYHEPRILDSLSNIIYDLKQKLDLKEYQKSIKFEINKVFLPPPPPPKSKK